MNRRGMTLLEMLVVLIIIGIIVQLLLQLFTGAARWTSRLNKQVLAAQAAATAAPKTVLEVVKVTENTPGKVIICFTNEQAYGCGAEQPCEFVDGKWLRKNKPCTDGVLMVK